MPHRWISTDNGSQCFQCGVVVDYWDFESDNGFDQAEYDKCSDLAHNLVPGCSGPETNRAHHYVLGVQRVPQTGLLQENVWEDILECAYGDGVSTPHKWTANPECIGA